MKDSSSQLPAVRLEREGSSLAQQAIDLQVTDADSFRRAGLMLQLITDFLAKVDMETKDVIKAAHEAHKQALAQKRRFEGRATEAKDLLRGRIGTYQAQQERLRIQAEQHAEAERMRLEAAERERVVREQAALQAEADRLRAQSVKNARNAGDTELARRLEDAPVQVPIVEPRPVFVPSPSVEITQAPGINFREHWSAEVTDAAALIRAVCAGTVPSACLQPNQEMLDQMARSLQDGLTRQVPGVRAVMVKIPIVKRA